MTDANMISEVQQDEQKLNGAGCLTELGWFLSGAILPMGSFAYYRKAAKKSVGSAILFFVLFTLVISTLSTIHFGATMFSVIGKIQLAYANGSVPDITISHGIARVDGPEPYIMLSTTSSNGQSTFVGVDTSGKIRQIDTSKYSQGFLLTRTELHILNQQNGYQRVPLSEFHTMFNQDPIIINAQSVSQAWGLISILSLILVFIFLVSWYTIVRLMIISTIALILWGIVSLIKPNTGFGPIIISGLYAIVPAIYLSHLFSRSNIGLPGLQTLFLMIFWIVSLVVNLTDIKFFSAERPLRLWTALIGVPMLILYIVDMFLKFPTPYGPLALWSVSLLTGLVLIGLRLYFRFKDQTPAVTLA